MVNDDNVQGSLYTPSINAFAQDKDKKRHQNWNKKSAGKKSIYLVI